ncbi:GNAT family N-acetyltransferase [Nocardia sp. CDC159]|uniref:GNAT family N-acetyltransferase n=1 Tax=Nocardia pulmonis TaxID=2951408 RepID=A0A9X2EE78_9NOCA|nr:MULTISPECIES: GNAT family N-acetyltransferase [Nocardia]MCM6776521.1 GNAT family N-acetyltransferase [Nocardia pulmonis]MCM6788945.1 GNAT family N-acetyltransferase [Nocardia sp. CDC159]
MVVARQAVVADAAELVRLRAVMLEALDGPVDDTVDWRARSAEMLRKDLDDPHGPVAAFVVDRPDEPGTIAACAIGVIHQFLPSPNNPAGTSGYVYSVATEDAYRRRGYSRACMLALLDWFRRREISFVDLNASEFGEPLYAALGFVRHSDPYMRLRLR